MNMKNTQKLSILVMDFETTGLKAPVHIAEFCTMFAEMDLMKHTFKFKAMAGAFVPPRTFEKDALKINGIDVEKLRNTHSMKALFRFLEEFLPRAQLVVGHNVLYDLRVLKTECQFYDVTFFPENLPERATESKLNIFCTCEHVKEVLKKENYMNLKKTANFFKIDTNKREMLYGALLKRTGYDPNLIRQEKSGSFHNAVFDVATVFSIFAKILKEGEEDFLKLIDKQKNENRRIKIFLPSQL